MSLNCFLLKCYNIWMKNKQEMLYISTSRSCIQRGIVGSHWGCLCPLSLPFLPCQISSQAYFPLQHGEGSSLLGDCLLQETQPLHRAEQREHQSKLMGPKGLCSVQNPPSHLCSNCRRELGTPGMLSLGTLPASQLAALLLLGVNERSSGFRCYSASFQNPAVWQEGR